MLYGLLNVAPKNLKNWNLLKNQPSVSSYFLCLLIPGKLRNNVGSGVREYMIEIQPRPNEFESLSPHTAYINYCHHD